MKKLHSTYFTFLFLILFCFLGKAQNYPTITPLTGGFTFPNQQLETHINGYRVNTLSCGTNFTNSYRYYSFKANFDMAFAFDLLAPNSGFKFLVWKLPAGSEPESIFLGSNSTLNPSRSVEGATLVKGLKETESEICEGFTTPGSNGYAKGFSGAEQLLRNEVVVIAIYGQNNSDLFDLKINVAEEREINSFNFKCPDTPYTYTEIKNAIQNHSSLNDITLYSDQNFNSVIVEGTNFTQNQIIYAQVKDAAGKLIYIYTVPLQFKQTYAFYYNLASYETCGNEFILDFDQIIRDNVTNYGDVSNFQIEYIEYNGTHYTNGQTVIFNDPFVRLYSHINYVGSAACSSSSTFDFSVRNVKIITDRNPVIETCSNDFIIDKMNLRLLTQIINDEDYDIKFYLPNGTEVFDGNTVSISGNQLILSYVPVHYATGCEGTRGTITINKTPEFPLRDAQLETCLSDVTQELIEEKLLEIKNGVTVGLSYYFNGNAIQESQILSIIQNNLVGRIEVKTNEGCIVIRELRFTISQSSIRLSQESIIHEETCVEASTVFNYSNQQLKEWAYANLIAPQNIGNYTFRFLDEDLNEITSINNLQAERRITVEVKLNNENCWTSFVLVLKRSNQPVVAEAAHSIIANCDDTITLTTPLLIELFGNSITSYQTNRVLDQPYTFQFNGSNEAQFTINFYQNETCQVTRTLTVVKGQQLNINIDPIQQHANENPYRFCGDAIANEVADYIQNYIDQILAIYPNVQPEQSANAYAQQMMNANGNVEVIFRDPNQCGSKILSLNYNPYPSPTLAIDSTYYTCTGYLYRLDLSAYENVRVYRADGTRVMPYNGVYELDLGDYTVEVENEYGCITSKLISVEPSPSPIIEEIILNVDSIEIVAHGNGGPLEYSLDGINWQNSNKFLGIQKGVNYTIYVRENQCAVVSIPNVVYLNLPNFISPNGDGINDIWKPIGVNSTLDVRIQIFNRYGKVVYQAEGPNALNWDGRFNQKPLPSDSYWYFIEYIDKQAVIKLKYQGYITIKSSK